MHTDSSASFTYFASRSASEWPTPVRTPSSRHARGIRSAISPRLAIRIFSNIGAAPRASLEHDERLAVLDRLAVVDQDRLDHPILVGLDLVHELHRLDDADRLPRLDGVADLDERLGVGRRRAGEGPDHRRLDDVPLGRGGRLGRRRSLARRGGADGGRGRRRPRTRGGDLDLPPADDLDLLLALPDLDLRDPGLLDEIV